MTVNVLLRRTNDVALLTAFSIFFHEKTVTVYGLHTRQSTIIFLGVLGKEGHESCWYSHYDLSRLLYRLFLLWYVLLSIKPDLQKGAERVLEAKEEEKESSLAKRLANLDNNLMNVLYHCHCTGFVSARDCEKTTHG